MGFNKTVLEIKTYLSNRFFDCKRMKIVLLSMNFSMTEIELIDLSTGIFNLGNNNTILHPEEFIAWYYDKKAILTYIGEDFKNYEMYITLEDMRYLSDDSKSKNKLIYIKEKYPNRKIISIQKWEYYF